MDDVIRIGFTWDFLTDGTGLLDSVLPRYFDNLKGVEYTHLVGRGKFIEPQHIHDFDAIIALHHLQWKRSSFVGIKRLAAIARWGVGYDMIDVDACTEHGIALCITPDAVRRPVAEGVLSLMLALSKHLLIKDHLVRAGLWMEKTNYMGACLAGRVLGCVGLGNIGAELIRLLEPFGMARFLACDPYTTPERVATLGVTLVTLDTLLRESDFVSLNCPLTPETYHLIGRRELSLMKPTSYLINTARGAVVDEDALIEALQEGLIAGAGLDVFENEPIRMDSPLLHLENVILNPHSIAWTEEMARDNGTQACENVLTIVRGEIPPSVVNREVIEKPAFQEKLRRLGECWRAFNQ